MNFPGGTVDKNLPVNVGDTGSIPDPGRSHKPWSLCTTSTELALQRPGVTMTEPMNLSY